MCGRYTVSADPRIVAERFGVAPAPGLRPRYNLAPGQDAPAVLAAPAPRHVVFALGTAAVLATGAQAKPQINARAETLADKPFFRESYKWRRLLIPADGWYEWPRRGADRSPRLYRSRTAACFAFAGLWESGSFAVVTVPANPLVARVHDRMPAILPRDAGKRRGWNPRRRPAPARTAPPPPVRAAGGAARVRAVGSVAVDEPALIAPAAQAQGDLFGA